MRQGLVPMRADQPESSLPFLSPPTARPSMQVFDAVRGCVVDHPNRCKPGIEARGTMHQAARDAIVQFVRVTRNDWNFPA